MCVGGFKPVKNHIIGSLILVGALSVGGCATKKYVAKTVDPVKGKLDTVAAQTDKQGQDIGQQGTKIGEQGTQIGQHGDQIKKQGEVLDQAQTDIAANKERAIGADNRATDALKKSDANSRDLSELRSVVANLDDYKPAGSAVVPFGFNKDVLTKDAKDELDKLVADKSTVKRYFIAVEGFTDKTGTVAYNNELSKRRAEVVMQYLVAKHDIPVYRIHMIGLGPEKPADEGRDKAARAKNRRVEVTFFTADKIAATASSTRDASR
jgi:outer membrane protein OmpA-like peptidoglycan-associated protein